MGERVTVYDEHEGFAWGQLAATAMSATSRRRRSATPGAAADAPGRGAAHLRLSGPEPEAAAPGLLSLGAARRRRRARRRLRRACDTAASSSRRISRRSARRAGLRRRRRALRRARPISGAARRASGSTARASSRLALAAAGIAAPARQRHAGGGARRARRARAGSPAFARGDLVFWKGHVGIMLDADRLLHANGHHMAVTIEPLAEAEERIRQKSYGPIIAVKRLPALGGSDLTSGVVPDGQSPIRNP